MNMDGRWWFGVCRWPSKKHIAEKFPGWTMSRPWFFGLGPVQVRIWPGLSKQAVDMIGPP